MADGSFMATQRLQAQFVQSDAKLAAMHARAKHLQTERDVLKQGLNELVAAGNFEELVRRSLRLSEIQRELASVNL